MNASKFVAKIHKVVLHFQHSMHTAAECIYLTAASIEGSGMYSKAALCLLVVIIVGVVAKVNGGGE